MGRRTVGALMIGLLVMLWAIMLCRCGIDPLLPTINAAVNLAQGLPADGLDGINCWDLNGDGYDDDEEDVNGDGLWDVYDCQGGIGPQGIQGAEGDRGDTGDRGSEGSSGVPGADGAAGVPGPRGESGRDGLNGQDGGDQHHCQGNCPHK